MPQHGPGQAVFALVREREKLFLFRFPPTESPGRELASCRGPRRAIGGALRAFPVWETPKLGARRSLSSFTPFPVPCLASSYRL